MDRIEKITKQIREVFSSIYTNKQKIRSLPNMSCSLERLLKQIHIHTIEELKQKGEINVFIELIKSGIEADHLTLFKLYGAIHHQWIYNIPPKVKWQLLRDVNESLYAEGLRRRFNLKL